MKQPQIYDKIIPSRIASMCRKKEFFDITLLPEASSTNLLLKQAAECGAREGTVLIAERQNSGRGRFDRQFFSPPGTGLYMSLLLRPEQMSAEKSLFITTMAAVAVCNAVNKLCGLNAGIKWVNDIYVDGHKVCGILTEGAIGNDGRLSYAVLGIGLNIYTPDGGFPQEISDVAGALTNTAAKGLRNRLCAEILNNFMAYHGTADSQYLDEYRSLSILIGKTVIVPARNSRCAVVTGIDDDCRLLVHFENGTDEALSSGEISVKPR